MNTNTEIKSGRGRKKGSPNTVYNIPIGEFMKSNIQFIPLPKKVAISFFGGDVEKIARNEPLTPKATEDTIAVVVS